MSVYITGCEKDSENVFKDSPLENRYDSLSSNSNSILENINFDQDGNILVQGDSGQIVIPHAGIEYQREVSSYFNELGDIEYWNNFYTNYGTPKWEISIFIRSVDTSKYNIIVPVFNNNVLTSIILYSTDGEEKIGTIYTQDVINEIVNIYNPDIEIINSYLFPVIIFQLYEYIIYDKKNDLYINWENIALSKYENIRYNGFTYRALCREMEIIDFYHLAYYASSGEIVWADNEPYDSKYIYYIVPCFGPPPYLGKHNPPTSNPYYNPPHPIGGKGGGLFSTQCIDAYYDFLANFQVRNMVENNTIIDPCDPGKTSEDIIREAICDKIKKNGVDNLGSVDELMKDLENNGGGKMNKTESFRNCKALNCLFDELYNGGITNFCDLQNNFETDSKVIDLKIGTESQFTSGRRAFTGIDSKTGNITIWFNPDICVEKFEFDESNPFMDFLRTTKTIIHESVHADFWREVADNLPDGVTLTTTDQSTFDEIFREFIDIICTEGDNMNDQHEAMMRSEAYGWIDKIAKDLWELNGKTGSWEDYKYLAWLGIYPKVTDDCVNSFLTIDEYKELRDNYEQNVWNNPATTINMNKINDCISN